jgi:hypothetical protein
VLGVDEVVPAPDLCGPYEDPTPLVFDDALEGPRGFSVQADGTRGLVHARYNQQTGPIPIKLVDGRWLPDDPNRQGTLVRRSGARMVSDGRVLAWQDAGGDQQIAAITMFEYVSDVWDEKTTRVGESPVRDLRAGNLVRTDLGNNGEALYAVQLEVPRDGVGRNTLQIRIKSSAIGGGANWFNTGFGDLLSTSAGVDPQAAVLTDDHRILVYAARVRGGTAIYESRLTAEKFPVGQRIFTITGEVDEPWINGDCSQIWFRRDGAIWTAARR